MEHALQHIPFYRELGRTLCSHPLLQEFPLIDGALIASRPEDFYCLDRFPDFVVTTGGTTGGPAKFFLMNLSEYDAAYRARLDARQTSEVEPEGFDPDQVEGVIVSLGDDQHGVRYSPRRGQPVLSLPLECGRHLDLVVRFLLEGIVVRGRRYPVLSLFGSVTKLRCLTRYCQSRGYRAEQFALRRIVSLAFHTSTKWKRTMSEFWGASVTTAYGLTEFSSGLTLACARCGGHAMPSIVHTEVLSVDRQRELASGIGVLVLTSLFPFRTVMPLIRYDTHDLVRRLPSCGRCGPAPFEFLGREGTVAWLEADAGIRVVTPLAILEALEAIDQERPGAIAYDESVSYVMSLGSGVERTAFRDTGYVRVNLEGGGAATPVRVLVERGTTRGAEADELQARFMELLSEARGFDCSSMVDVSWVAERDFRASGKGITLI